jgi:hypothetical protein
VTVVGITGHRELSDAALARRQIDAELARLDPPLVGVSSLAAGADQLFADAVLDAGGSLAVILPGLDYRDTLPEECRGDYDRLLDAAVTVTTLDHEKVGKDAYVAAGLAILDRIEVLIAVWDGERSRGRGGTADLVRRARESGIPVRIVGAERA